MQFLLKKFLKRNKYINYFLSQCNSEENGDLISNLKIQKLVYYAQGFSLAINNKPLFSEKIQAWTHGPVTPELYNKYKQYGNGALPTTDLDIDFDKFSNEEKDLLNDINDVYGQFSAWKLRNNKLSKFTWQELRNSPRHGCGTEKIEHKAIKGCSVPDFIIEQNISLLAFRFQGKKPMVGYRENQIFHILWLDRDYSLYNHGS
ncbi:Panacea domain-containing protein [[Haemophilus] ducreyi]|uniref:Panacea domain-containing protein n=1 Tax=Haemophilus ducreyi TaxID=730 RepID=UPI000A94E248|nr:type II toxin-antitoxin system antitoxin SocA domain-containing protein [[Haemophilus] ducreyi]